MFKKITNAELKSELLEIQEKIDKLNTTSELKSILFDINSKIDKLNTRNDLDENDTNDKNNIHIDDELKLQLLNMGEKIDKLNNVLSSTLKNEIDYKYIINELSDRLEEMYECNLENMNKMYKHTDDLIKQEMSNINNTINTNNETLSKIFNNHINKAFSDYNEIIKIDIIDNNKVLIDKNEVLIDKNEILIDKNEMIKNKLEEYNKEINIMLKNIDEKIISIYFENELMKHQLVLEDEIRMTIQEVKNLGDIVNSAISQIDSIINKE